jgi:hypothetical protein
MKWEAGSVAAGWWPRRGWVLLLLVGLAAGCGSTGTISGTVTYKGKPLKAGTVSFMTTEGGHVASGEIKEDGTYTVSRVPAGPAKVTVKSVEVFTPPGGGMMGGRSGGGAPRGAPAGAAENVKPPPGVDMSGFNPNSSNDKAMKVPDKYKDFAKTPLTCDVKSGNQPYDIQLTD